MKQVPEVLKNLGGVISRNSPTILTGAAVAGLVSTAVLAVRATPKAMSLIDDEVWRRYEESGTKDTFAEWLGVDTESYSWRDRTNMLGPTESLRLVWRCYIPSGCLGIATIGCIIGANSISLRRNAALASVYSLTEVAFKEYQAKVAETIGKNKELKVRDEISADHLKKNPSGSNEIIYTGKGEVLCYDTLTGRYFKSEMEQIRRVVNDLNQAMMHENFMSLNDLYYALGLSGTTLGNELGWRIDDGQIDIRYSTQLSDKGEPCLVLNYEVKPTYM